MNQCPSPTQVPDPHLLRTVRVRRLTLPVEAVREELRDAVRNERAVRAMVIVVWSAAAFLIGLLVAIAR